jgi:hypothetical protein
LITKRVDWPIFDLHLAIVGISGNLMYDFGVIYDEPDVSPLIEIFVDCFLGLELSPSPNLSLFEVFFEIFFCLKS